MNCKTCGHPLEENYCPSCGEKKFDPEELSVKHFVEETFEGMIHFDNKFFHTLRTLVAKPGQLSLDYVQGKRAVYMKPVQFFLVVNLLFFFLILYNLYSLPLYNYITYKPFIGYHTREIVQQKINATHLTTGEFEQLFNEKIQADSKEYIFLFIPFYAFVFWAIFFAYKKNLVEHLIFATHFVAFVLCWFFLQNFLIGIPFYFFTHDNYSQIFDTIISILTGAVVAVYFMLAARRFYQKGWWWIVVTGLAVGYTFFPIIPVSYTHLTLPTK